MLNLNGRYFVTPEGKVFSNLKGEMKPLTPFLNGEKGYWKVVLILTRGGKPINKYVHRLVAQTYIPNPDNLPQVNHIDGVKSNNCVENLEWVTSIQNIQHAKDEGLLGKGETHARATITEAQAQAILDAVTFGVRVCHVCYALKVSEYVVNKIKSRVSWRHLVPSHPRSLDTSVFLQMKGPEKEAHFNASISQEDAQYIKDELKKGRKVRDLSTSLGVSYDVVRHIKLGNTWAWLP